MKKILRLSGTEFFPVPDFRMALVPMRSGKIIEQVNYTYVPHRHDFSEMVLVTSGEGIQVINGVDYAVRQGDLFLLDGEIEHFFRKQGGFALINLLFDRKTLQLPWDRFQRYGGYNLFFMVGPRLRTPRNFSNRLHLSLIQQKALETMLHDLHDLLTSGRPDSEMLALARLIEVIHFVSSCCEVRESAPRDMLPRIGEAVSRLETHFAEDISLEDLARDACMSTRNFTRCFRRGTGMSPIAFLHYIRLRHAAMLLKNESSMISEVALQCGFHDSNYFTKLFALRYGVSPAAYRKIGGGVPPAFR